jgi:hypothetical protein
MREEKQEAPKEHYYCKKESISEGVFFVCELGNELSKMNSSSPVSFAEMQDALIALGKADELDKDQLFYTMESYLSKSGTDDARANFDEAFNTAAVRTKEAYPALSKTRKNRESL